MTELLSGFSSLSQSDKIKIVSELCSDPDAFTQEMERSRHPVAEVQKIMNDFSENTLGNFHLPFGVAPNFKINGKDYVIPMVTEESSVVAAAAAAAKWWYSRGGFKVSVIDNQKKGQIYFKWQKNIIIIQENLPELREYLIDNLKFITKKMDDRGGGICSVELKDLKDIEDHLCCLDFSFSTADSMGANFINTVLEEGSKLLTTFFEQKLAVNNNDFQVLMSILSNYTPECRVKAELRTSVDELAFIHKDYTALEIAERIISAVNISLKDVNRAVTHNKGIFNAVDAVLIACGNDYRAVEASAHAYASKNGQYSGLSYAGIDKSEFYFGLEIPLAIGTVGGLTSIHPVVKWSLDIMGKPNATELMGIVASAGLANNFSAIKSLVTTGIQKGHMKLHLENILNYFSASVSEKVIVIKHFSDKNVSFSGVESLLKKIRE